MNFEKDLKTLETKQEKIIFLRDFVLNKKTKEKEKEKAIKILNELLQEDNLEERLSFKSINLEGKQIKVKQEFTQKINLNFEEPKEGRKYSTGVVKEKKKKESTKKIIYTSDPKTNIRNLRSFLDRKGLLSHPILNKQEISEQITDYFGGNVPPNKIERYFTMFSQDSIGYQAFGKSEEEETNISGRKIRYYKILPKEETR